MEKDSDEYGDGWGHRRGTRRFMSPELVGDMVLDYGADVWAFGCTVLEMLTGERFWGEYGDDIDWEDWISLVGESGSLPYVPDSLSEGAKDFLSKCLVRDPAKRWTVEKLLKHPFLVHWTSGIYEDEEEEERYEEVEIEEEEEEEEEEEIGVAVVEAHEAYPEEEEEEEEEYGDEFEEDADVEAYLEYGDPELEAYLAYGDAFEEQEQATEIDEEYPKELDSEEDM